MIKSCGGGVLVSVEINLVNIRRRDGGLYGVKRWRGAYRARLSFISIGLASTFARSPMWWLLDVSLTTCGAAVLQCCGAESRVEGRGSRVERELQWGAGGGGVLGPEA